LDVRCGCLAAVPLNNQALVSVRLINVHPVPSCPENRLTRRFRDHPIALTWREKGLNKMPSSAENMKVEEGKASPNLLGRDKTQTIEDESLDEIQ
jgi:hypothetical protein